MGKVQSLVSPIIDFLIKKARQRSLTTYSEIANHVGTHHRVVPKVLWQIDNIRLENNLPPITAIVIRKDSSVPGDHFLNYLCPGESKEEQVNKWKSIIQEVYDYKWNNWQQHK